MKINRNIIYAFAAAVFAVAAVSCGKEPAGSGGIEYGDIPIVFKTEDNWNGAQVTKAAEEFPGNEFGVYAYYYAEYDSANPSANSAQVLMANQSVRREDTSAPWTYSPTRYWPTNDSEKLHFVAFYPYTEPRMSITEDNATGYPTISYTAETVEADDGTTALADEGLDLLVSSVGPISYHEAADRFGAPGKISFAFSHALARVSFKFKIKGSILYPMKLSKIVVSGVPVEGTYSYSDGGTWSVAKTEEITIIPENPVELDNAPKELFTSLMIPVGSSITSVKVYVTENNNDAEVLEKVCDLSATPLEFKPNTNISVKFLIAPEPGVGDLYLEYVEWEEIVSMDGTLTT